MQSIELLFVMVLSLVTIFMFMFILSGVKVVNAWERVVILRLGRYRGITGPGVIWKMPILDKIALRVSLREQSTDVDTGKLKGFVQWKVVDVEKFALSIEDHYNTVNRTIQHHVIKTVESTTTDAVFSDSYEFNSQVDAELQPTLAEWGLTVTKVELRTVTDWT